MDFELTDEQRLIRETARAFTENEIVERARENDRNERFDVELVQMIAAQGYLGAIVPARVRRRRARLPDLRGDRRGDRARRLGDADRDLGADVAGLLGDPALGHRGAEAALPAEAVLGRVARLLRADRARHRLGRRQPAHPRQADRLGLGDQRRQDVDLARQPRQAGDDLRPDRPREGPSRAGLLPGRDRGQRRLPAPGDPSQDGPARLRHRVDLR